MGHRRSLAANLNALLLASAVLLPLQVDAQSSDTAPAPARGGVGIVQGQLGVERTLVDERSKCIRDRLIGARPQLGVERTPVGVERDRVASPPPAQPLESKDPCAKDDDASVGETLANAVQTVLEGARRIFRAIPLSAIVPAI